MKVFSVYGYTQSGKTTTIENIIKELKKRRYSVGSVKEIHFEQFEIDTKGSNTDRHKKAGAELVTARGYFETDVLFPEKLPMEKILRFYDQDYVVLEGVTDYNIPKILTTKSMEEIEERIDETVFAISGRMANEIDSYKGIPVINSIDNLEELVNLVEEKVFEKLPDFDPKCCMACGYDCRTLGVKILNGQASRDDCVISKNKVKLFIDDKEIDMVPFVQDILSNVVEGVVSELDGYKKNAHIRIEIGNENEKS